MIVDLASDPAAYSQGYTVTGVCLPKSVSIVTLNQTSKGWLR